MPSISNMINTDNDITYPPGVKGISEELPIEELVKRLKIAAGVFQNFGQNDDVSCYENFALHIASEEFMNHTNKEVKLLTACIIADVFRVFAPDAPYRDPALLKAIFTFFIEQLRGIKVNTGLFYQRHFYLLECLAWVKAFNICFDLDDGQEIFCKLFKLFFCLISDGQGKVKNYMLDIMSAILVDIDNVSNELLESVLTWIIEPHKTQKKECFNLAKDLIKRTNSILEPYVQQYFTTVLFPDKDKDNGDTGNRDDGSQAGSDTEKENELDNQLFGPSDKRGSKKKKNSEKPNNQEGDDKTTTNQSSNYSKLRVYDFIHELYSIAPNLLVNVIPLLDFKLKSDKNDERLHVTRALGRIFSGLDSNLAAENPSLWKSFLGRYNDIEIPVRLACVQYSVHFLRNHPSLVADVAEHMAPRAYDPDEGVRHEVVVSLVAACCPNVHTATNGPMGPLSSVSPQGPGVTCPILLSDGKLMDCLRSRTLDKKFRIRKEALMGLGNIYKSAYAQAPNAKQCQMGAADRLKLGWIRDQTMHAYYQNTTEDQILVERVFNTCIVPFNLPTQKRMYRLLHLFVNIDDHSLKALTEMWKKHFVIRTLASKYVDARFKSLEEGGGSLATTDDDAPPPMAAAAVAGSGNDDKRKAEGYGNKRKAEVAPPLVDEINTKLYQISKMLPDPIKSLDYMKRFDQELNADPKLLKNLQTLLTQPVSCKDACQLCKNILKRMGNPQVTNQLYTNTKQFLERVAPLMVDSEAIVALCTILQDHEELVRPTNKSGIHPFYEGPSPETAKPTAGKGSASTPGSSKSTTAAQKAFNELERVKERGFRLLQTLSCVFGSCFRSPGCVELLSSLLQNKDEKTAEFALQILANVVRSWTDCDREAVGLLSQTLQKLCKGANPKHTKYAVNALHALLSRDRAKLVALDKSLLKVFGDNLKKSPDTVPYLVALSGLGQMAFNRPEIAGDIHALTQNLTPQLFPDYNADEDDSGQPQDHRPVPGLESLAIPTDYWSTANSNNKGATSTFAPISHLCKARILYLKLRCKVLLGLQKNMQQSQGNPKACTELIAETKAFFGLLFSGACINNRAPTLDPKSPTSRTNTLALNEYVMLKLKGACAVLKMVQTATFWEALSLPQYQSLARLVCDVECLDFRQKMVCKLHKALFSLKLPLEYLAVFALCHGEANKELKTRCKQYLVANVAKRRDFLRTNPSSYTSKIYAILPDYALPYAIHLLAHSPKFTSKDDLKGLESIKDALWFLIEPLMHKNENYSFSFFKKLIENIKQTRDAQDPTCQETNEKLYAVCDIALGLVWTRSSTFELKDFPGKPILPAKLFTQPLDCPNTKIYLPSQYGFSPAKKKVTRPDLYQFFSLTEGQDVVTKVRRNKKVKLPYGGAYDDDFDSGQEAGLADNSDANETTTSGTLPRSGQSATTGVTHSEGPSSLCSSTPKNLSQAMTSSSHSPPTLPNVSTSKTASSPYPTPPLSSQEGQLPQNSKTKQKRKKTILDSHDTSDDTQGDDDLKKGSATREEIEILPEGSTRKRTESNTKTKVTRGKKAAASTVSTRSKRKI